ncbi:MAG: hypothetical protein QNK37_07260 [Acidobacteriota bacterium]|nr:hypothetical protein [Acidobacteriota bacterium]
MARRIKLQKDGALYHVMTRTAQQIHWLKDPAVKEMFADHMNHLAGVSSNRLVSCCSVDPR